MHTGMRAGRRITATDVAAEAGVSRATVGFVLNRTSSQSISSATAQRVLAAAERLGYQPHGGARALRSGHSRIVLLVLPDLPVGHALRELLEAATVQLAEAGYQLVVHHHVVETAVPLWSVLLPEVVLGFEPFSAADVLSMRRAGVEHVLPAEGDRPVAAFWPAAQGVALQIGHLAESGHRRIGCVLPAEPRLAARAALRAEVLRQACAAHGLGAPRTALIAPDVAGAAAIVRDWVDGEGVTAICGYDDELAAAVVSAALRGGLRVPADLSVLGFDDTPVARLLVPSLSTVAIDNRALGRYVAEIALGALRGRRADSVPLPDAVRLTVRESSGPPVPGRRIF
ncbi:HTH-type transcriptional repressor CytR [Actinoalloteichus hoggarensis]|uniref:HTH-type transcriptional repressor CytR n=2 Tax=Actinoalloteichus hoggarensis TaxID=1470176 RepID=A0A221W4S8_9PSEU|nr:HTH-type transcriptional repressor CytR [Actinoalloteichus hoggarensis]